MFIFWLIVVAYQSAAFDSLQDWRISKAVWKRIEPRSDDHKIPLGGQKLFGP